MEQHTTNLSTGVHLAYPCRLLKTEQVKTANKETKHITTTKERENGQTNERCTQTADDMGNNNQIKCW